MHEIWKKVHLEKYSDYYYYVSNLGRVKSIKVNDKILSQH